mgnify:CR=1 FL=1
MVERVPLKKCWDYAGERDIRPYPVMEFIVRNPVVGREAPVRARVDTGFSGELMLAFDYWRGLELGKTILASPGEYGTFAGPLITWRAPVILLFPGLDLELEAIAETPISFPGLPQRTLVGRGVLNKLFLELRGPEEKCCAFRGDAC